MRYRCLKCKHEFDSLERVRCPKCGYRIIAKVPENIVREYNAR